MSEPLHFNGINGLTGEYLFEPMAPEHLGRIARGQRWDPSDPHLQELKWRYEQRARRTFVLKAGLDPKRLDQAGWGVIFPADAPPSAVAAIREALSPLLDLRHQQAGDLYREFTSAEGYRRGEGKNRFLARHKVGPGPVDPSRVPYYLLIIGDPESIPYRVQYELDVAYAVGRLHFNTLDEYAQ